MEPNQHEDSKSGSSEETNKFDQPASDEMGGTGRSYECVFCKRGFTTAQALGGHMNVHRKDRIKSKPSSSSSPAISSKVEEGYGSFRAPPPIQSYPSFYPTNREVHLNYQRFYPGASTRGFRPSYAQNSDDSYAQNSQHLISQLEEGRRISDSLSLQFGIDPSDIDEENRRKMEEEDDGLDLELRLGYHDR